MNVSYFVRYEGQAESPKAFRDYYRQCHVPILARWPGVGGSFSTTPSLGGILSP